MSFWNISFFKKNIFLFSIIIFIFLSIFSIFFTFNIIKSASIVKIVSIEFFYKDNYSSSGVDLYRITPKDKIIKISNNKKYYYEIDRGYIKNIRIIFPQESFEKLDSLKLRIGNIDYDYTHKEIINKWREIENNGKIIFELPKDIKVNKSHIPMLADIINWSGDFKVFLFGFTKSLAILILIIIILLVIYYGNSILVKFGNNNHIFNDNKYFYIIFIIINLLLLSVISINTTGVGDVNFFLKWMDCSHKFGIVKGYTEIKDNYPPLSYLIIALEKRISIFLNVKEIIIFKISNLLFIIITFLLFYYYTKNIIITISLYASLLLCTTFLGFIDIMFAPFLIISLFGLYKRKYVIFSVFYTLTCLIKYQPIIILPFIFLFLIEIKNFRDFRKINFKRLVLSIFIPAFLLFSFFLIIFNYSFIKSFIKALSHNTLSAYALNLNWFIQYLYQLINGNVKLGQEIVYYDFINIKHVFFLKSIKLIFFILYFFTLYNYFLKKKDFHNFLNYSLLGYFTYFTINVGVHQHHLFLVVILAAIIWHFEKDNKLFILISIIFNINIFLFYGINGTGPGFSKILLGIDSSIFFALSNFIFYIILFYQNIFRNVKDQQNSYE